MDGEPIGVEQNNDISILYGSFTSFDRSMSENTNFDDITPPEVRVWIDGTSKKVPFNSAMIHENYLPIGENGDEIYISKEGKELIQKYPPDFIKNCLDSIQENITNNRALKNGIVKSIEGIEAGGLDLSGIAHIPVSEGEIQIIGIGGQSMVFRCMLKNGIGDDEHKSFVCKIPISVLGKQYELAEVPYTVEMYRRRVLANILVSNRRWQSIRPPVSIHQPLIAGPHFCIEPFVKSDRSISEEEKNHIAKAMTILEEVIRDQEERHNYDLVGDKAFTDVFADTDTIKGDKVPRFQNWIRTKEGLVCIDPLNQFFARQRRYIISRPKLPVISSDSVTASKPSGKTELHVR